MATETTSAIQPHAPQEGDEHLIRAVLPHQGRTGGEALDVLTDTDLADVFGPGWAGVIQVVRQAASLTADQARRIHDAARDAAWADARPAAEDAAQTAARTSDRADAWHAAKAAAWTASWNASRDSTWDRTWDVAWTASWSAAWAAVVRDLITPDQHDTLTAPWRAAFPEDPA